MKKFILILAALLLPTLVSAQSGSGGSLVINNPYETEGEKHWFATSSGIGDCTSWSNACSFRTAVGKCTSTVQDVIHLSAGDHDTDNGSDGNGTTITVNNVYIKGITADWVYDSNLINADAAAVYILQVTGDNFSVQGVNFTNVGQADPNVIHLRIAGDEGSIEDCKFIQDDGVAVTGTGILFDTDMMSYRITHVRLQEIMTEGTKTNGATNLIFREMHFIDCGIGADFVGGANDSNIIFHGVHFHENTTAINIAASVDDIIIESATFDHNATNIVDAGVWDGLHIINGEVIHQPIKIYPPPTPGGATTLVVSVNTGDGIDTWTAAAVQIIPVDTITTPFRLTSINISSATAANTFRIEVFYGEAVANISAGVYAFTSDKKVIPVFTPQVESAMAPSNSIIGVKLLSDTDGVDNCTLSLSYQEL